MTELTPARILRCLRSIVEGGKRMTELTPKEHALEGMNHLEKAVLDVLREANQNGECIGAAEISKRAGIYRDRGSSNMMNDAISTGLLVKLESERRVKRCKQRNNQGGWELI